MSILCIQETHAHIGEQYRTSGYYLVVVAGHNDDNQREYAGVGFLIAPHIVHSVVEAICFSNRVACLKLPILRGIAGMFSVYAPHNAHSKNVRQT